MFLQKEVEMDENKKKVVKNVLKKLTEGLNYNEARREVEEKIGTITSEELFEIEQSLINEGVKPEEIKRFCNVHAMLFENMFNKKVSDVDNPLHPISLFKRENREIEKMVEQIKDAFKDKDYQKTKKLLEELGKIDIHYQRKEQVLFPYLEKLQFFGPTQVMWGKDDEIRDLFKKCIENIESQKEDFFDKYLNPFLEEVLSMIFKEENILFPTCLEKLSKDDWVKIFKESTEVGYVFIEPPKEVFEAKDIVQRSKQATYFKEDKIYFPTGNLTLEEIRVLLNTLPFDISFIDKDDKVRFYSDNQNRIFLRTPSVIGREVRNCHPPKSLKLVEQVIDELKSGKKDVVEFWINFGGRLIHIRYFAVKDEFKNYLGIVETTQDITEIKKIEGEKRLINE